MIDGSSVIHRGICARHCDQQQEQEKPDHFHFFKFNLIDVVFRDSAAQVTMKPSSVDTFWTERSWNYFRHAEQNPHDTSLIAELAEAKLRQPIGMSYL